MDPIVWLSRGRGEDLSDSESNDPAQVLLLRLVLTSKGSSKLTRSFRS